MVVGLLGHMGCLFGGLDFMVASGAGRVCRQPWRGTITCGIRPKLDATEGAAILERDCIVSWGVGSFGAALGNLRLAHPSPGYGNEGTNVRLCRRTKTLAGNHLNPRDGGRHQRAPPTRRKACEGLARSGGFGGDGACPRRLAGRVDSHVPRT